MSQSMAGRRKPKSACVSPLSEFVWFCSSIIKTNHAAHADSTSKVALVSINSHGQPLHRYPVNFSEDNKNSNSFKALRIDNLSPGTYTLLSHPHHLSCYIRVLPPPPSPPPRGVAALSNSAAAGRSNVAVRAQHAAGDAPGGPDVVVGGVVYRKMVWGLEALVLRQPVEVHALHASNTVGIQVGSLCFLGYLQPIQDWNA